MKSYLILLRMDVQPRSRRLWAAGAAIVLALLTIGLVYACAGVAAQAGFGMSAGAVVNVYMLVIPLGALVLGSLSIVRDRESGALAYLAAQPVAHDALFAAKWISLTLQLCIVVGVSFVALGVALAALHVPFAFDGLVQFMLATWLFALAMGTLGMAISAASRSTPIALAVAIALWLLFIVFADVGAMGGALATHMSTSALLLITSANPVEAYKIASVAALEGSVDVFGPGGRLATETLGAYVMPVLLVVVALWAAGGTAVARWRFGRALDA